MTANNQQSRAMFGRGNYLEGPPIGTATNVMRQMGSGNVQRLTADGLGNFYGANGLFDPTGQNDLLSLTYAGSIPLADAFGWTPSTLLNLRQPFLVYTGAKEVLDDTQDTTEGWVEDESAARNAVQGKVQMFEIAGFGHLGRSGGVFSIYDTADKWQEDQRFRLDGTPVNTNYEYRAHQAMDVLAQDFRQMLVKGNKATTGHFNGLELLVKTGITDYTATAMPSMDSIVVTWNSGDLAPATPATWLDGRGASQNIVEGTPLIRVIRSIVWAFLQRIQYVPQLSTQQLRVGDIIIAAPLAQIQGLLDAYTAFRVDYPYDSSAVTVVATKEALDYRDSLAGGLFGFGRIFIDGLEIPLVLAPDEMGNDVYVLTRKVGSYRTFYGEFQDMNAVTMAADTVPGLSNVYGATDGGRFLHYVTTQQTIQSQTVDFKPRLVCKAPYLCARIVGFQTAQPGGVISGNIFHAGYFGGGDQTP